MFYMLAKGIFYFFGGLNAWPKTDIHILRHELNIQLIFNSTFQMKFGNVIIYRSSFVGVNCYKLGLLRKDEGCAYFREEELCEVT